MNKYFLLCSLLISTSAQQIHAETSTWVCVKTSSSNDDAATCSYLKDVQYVQNLVNTDTINVQNQFGYTALTIAIRNNHIECIQLLVNAGAYITTQNEDCSTALAYAIEKNNQELVTLLLKAGVNPNAVNRFGSTPLTHAAHYGHIEIAKILIDFGADITVRDAYGRTALSYALSVNNPKTIALLIQTFPIILKTEALHMATTDNKIEWIKLLINAGADINFQHSNNTNTPLMLAIMNDNIEAIKILLNAGATINIQNKHGETAFDMIYTFSPLNPYSRAEIVKLLRLYGAKTGAELKAERIA